MSTTFPVNFKINELSALPYSLKNIYAALARNLTGSTSGILSAIQDPTLSKSSDGSTWYAWNPAIQNYAPVNTSVGTVRLTASPTANRLQRLSKANGEIALLDDTYGIRDTVVLPEGLVSVDWDTGTRFLCVLSNNRQSAFYMFHSKPGMEISLVIVNSGTKQTVGAWDSSIHWPGTTAPTMPAATPGKSASLYVTLRNVNGTIYGESSLYNTGPIGQ